MSYGTYGHTYNTYKNEKTECHWGNPLVFTTHDGIEVYAGGSSRGGGWWRMEPLPDLAMGPDNEVRKGYSSLEVKTKFTNTRLLQILLGVYRYRYQRERHQDNPLHVHGWSW